MPCRSVVAAVIAEPGEVGGTRGEHEVDAAALQFGEQRVADVADGPEVDQHRADGIQFVETGPKLVEQWSSEVATDRPFVVGLGEQVGRPKQRDRGERRRRGQCQRESG